VLVALPPLQTERRVGTLLIMDVVPGPAIAGTVRQVGSAVTDLAPGDRVIFGAEVGEWLEWEAWPHLLLRAVDIDAVIERTL
jgi:NADPH:quinone reductase-like Zn-dependent oxidoreductase